MIKMIIYGNPPSKSNCYKVITLTPKATADNPKPRPHGSIGKTPVLREYEEIFAKQITMAHRKELEGSLTARVKVYYDSERPDLDNAFKIIFDCLQKNGVIKNDRQIRKIIGEKFKDDKTPRIHIELTEYVPEAEAMLFEPSVAECEAWIEGNAPDWIARALLKAVKE